jgi:hypothetical protein
MSDNIRDYGYVRCRAVGHLWEDYRPLGRSNLGAVLTFRCAYCGKERKDVVSRATGELVTRSYTNVNGYKAPLFDKQDMRKEFVRRYGKGEVRKQRVRTGRASR